MVDFGKNGKNFLNRKFTKNFSKKVDFYKIRAMVPIVGPTQFRQLSNIKIDKSKKRPLVGVLFFMLLLNQCNR